MKEEDTVTVGQDLVKLEPGGVPEGKKEDAGEKPKEPAAPEKSQPSEPEQPKAPEATKTPQPPPEQPSAPKPEPPKPQPPSDAKPTLGIREERRVGCHNNVAP